MSTQWVSIREARQRLRHLLEQGQGGNEVIVLRRGVEVGRLVRTERTRAALPDLSDLRASVRVRGRALSQEITAGRRSSRH